MKLGYYPGCSLKGSAREFDESIYALARRLDLHLEEVPDWNCCGSTAAHNLSHLLSLALPARVLALAERANLNEILVPCAECYNRLATAAYELGQDEALRAEVSGIIEMEYKGTSKVLNIIEALNKIFAESGEIKIAKPFNHKVACYYGCLLVRPPQITKFDRPEDPESMDELIKKIGGEPVDWAFKTECCGAGFSISRTDLVCKLSGKIIENAIKAGADALVVACPMCHANLDMRRADIEKFTGKKYPIPVLYISQAVGLALGLDEKELGLHRHLVPVILPERKEPAGPEKAAEQQPAAGAEE